MNYQVMNKGRDSTINTNAEKSLHVEIYDSFEQLKAVQEEWDNFIGSVGSEIFLTYDWCRIWWEHYGAKRKLRIYIFRHENMIVGIIPLFFEKIWLGPVFVRAVKIVGSDFTLSQFCIPFAPGYIRVIVEKFYESISSENNWDILHIGPIAGLYQYYDDLKNTCEELFGRSYDVLCVGKDVQTYFKLADDWEKQLAGLKKDERYSIRRSYKTLCSDTTGLISNFASIDNFKQLFDNFVEMHQSYWKSLGKLGHFGDWPAAYEFHQEVAEAQLRQKRLRLLEVKYHSGNLGYKYGYRCGNRYFEFLNARSVSKGLKKVSVGKVLFNEQVKKVLDEGVRCIDSMRGRYEHKLRLGGELFPIRNIYITRRKFYALVRVFVFRAFSRLLRLCYFRIWYCRIAQKLPVKRRHLWRIWIKSSAFAS
jgi:CelD/BcsL family acetyltransferase involved in cellulose biosynthesis